MTDDVRMTSVRVRNGDEIDLVTLPASRLLDVLEPAAVAAASDPDQLVREALDEPISAKPLEELARGCRRVVVVCDDMTRPTPVWRLMPAILERLARAGVGHDQILVLIATGTHRPMTDAELRAKLGDQCVNEYRVENHRYDALDNLVDLGTTERGIPVSMNRSVAEADLVIGVGNIVPHRYCGWAGGAKIVQPGTSGEATTAATHLMITKDPLARLGVVESGVRHDIEAVADRVSLRFIVNTVLNRDLELVAVVAGDFRAAFRAGVAVAREVYGSYYSTQAEIVVASAYPSDLNLWQAGKALYSGDLVVRDGGLVILVSPCTEGVGEHGSFADLLRHDYAAMEAMVSSGRVADRISAAAALAVALVRMRCDIWLVSAGISPADAETMGMRRLPTTQAAVDEALVAYPDGRLTFLQHATEVLPLARTADVP